MIQIINLHASWCQPCKYFESTFKKVSEEPKYKDIEFKRFDIDEDEGFGLSEKYHIRSVPTTLILDDDGNELYKVIGNVPAYDLTAIIDLTIKKHNSKEEE